MAQIVKGDTLTVDDGTSRKWVHYAKGTFRVTPNGNTNYSSVVVTGEQLMNARHKGAVISGGALNQATGRVLALDGTATIEPLGSSIMVYHSGNNDIAQVSPSLTLQTSADNPSVSASNAANINFRGGFGKVLLEETGEREYSIVIDLDKAEVPTRFESLSGTGNQITITTIGDGFFSYDTT